jgi:signal transduction histidine kinase
VVLAIAFGVVAELEIRLYGQSVLPGHVGLALDSLLVLLPLVPVAWRRAAPLGACVAVAGGLTLVGAALGGTVCFFGGLFPFLVVLYSASAWAHAPRDRMAAAVPFLLMAPMHWYVDDFRIPSDLVFGLSLSGMAWAAGQGARRWRDRSQQLAVALEDARAGRDARAALAVAEERARIARELHDVVAHGMSVMVMQAGAARLDLRDRPTATDAALAQIERTGRAGLLEMRRLLGILRSDEPGGLAPQPGLGELPELVARLERSGLQVEQRVVGRARPLTEAEDLSAYRIVQEALTNALRHGGGARARLRLSWTPTALEIVVSNPVPSASPIPPGRGHGLIGIEERAALFGGTCRVEHRDGRHVLEVLLPYEEDRQAPARPGAATEARS